MPTKMYMISGMMLTHHPMTPQNLAWLKHYNPAFIGNVHAHTHSADTGLSPALWQCVSMEKVDYKPIMWSDVRKRFLDVEKIMEWCENGGDNSNYFKTGDHIRR
jgi:calcineurin-like phosphoesterase family protein